MSASMLGEETCNQRENMTYHVQQIVVPIVKMLIEIFLFIETFFAVSTLPFIYIQTNLMLFLISVQVIIRMQPTPPGKLIPFFVYKWHQILQQSMKVIVINVESNIQT